MRTGIIASNFDVLHPGYIRMLKEASEDCDFLTVALHVDPSIENPKKLKPILSIEDRIEMLNSVKYINAIFPYKTELDLHNLISELAPSVRYLGDDYKGRTDYTGYGLCPEVYFIDRSHGWSTTKYKYLISKSLGIS